MSKTRTIVASTLTAVCLALLSTVSVGAAPAVLQASGGGSFVDDKGNEFTFGFTARLDTDGSARGQFEIHNRTKGNMVHLEIVSMEIEIDRVVLHGIITKAVGISDDVGTPRQVSIQDNGEGAKAPPDRISKISKEPQELNELFEGNIQIR